MKETICECCAKLKDCVENRGLYLCEDCVWEFGNAVDSKYRNEDIKKILDKTMGNPIEALDKLTLTPNK